MLVNFIPYSKWVVVYQIGWVSLDLDLEHWPWRRFSRCWFDLEDVDQHLKTLDFFKMLDFLKMYFQDVGLSQDAGEKQIYNTGYEPGYRKDGEGLGL